METVDQEAVNAVLALLAPGTELRDGLERIVRGRTGALIVLGNDRTVEQISTGGFELNVDFSSTRLRELAKMDGAVVLSTALTRIVRAATQLVPDAAIETRESGTRHRTAERAARQTGVPVVSVSASMSMIALVDNRDSFTFNIAQELMGLGAEVGVVRALESAAEDVLRLRPAGIVLGPGPGRPGTRPRPGRTRSGAGRGPPSLCPRS